MGGVVTRLGDMWDSYGIGVDIISTGVDSRYMSTATATVKIVKEQPDEDGYYECGYDMHTAGYLVYIDGEFVGAVYRDPTVAAGYWSAWKGAGVGSTRKAAVAEVVARWNAKK